MENDAVAVANCFADYLANVALDIEGNVYMISLRRITNITPALRNRKFHNAALDFNFRVITETDVSDVIENMNPRKSSSWNSPTVSILLKKTASAIAPSSMTVLQITVLLLLGKVF